MMVCAVVVAIDPWALMQPGFWLSFVAVGVLFAANPRVADEDHAAGRPGFQARLTSLWREQWIVTLALTPLTLLLFQQISVVGLPANAVAIPWVTLVVTPLSMLGVLAPPLWELASWAVHALSWWLQWLARWPWATLSMPAPPLWMATAGVAGGILLAMRLPWSMRMLGLSLLMPVLLWLPPRPAAGEFELLAADVGQGNAVLVRTATHSLLYDTGPRYSLESDAGDRVLVPLLRAFGERIDTVILSHRDSDHTGGAAAVLATQPRARLLSSIEADHPLQALRRADRCIAGLHWVWDGVDFEILHPAGSDYAAATAARTNALSCVLRIGNGHAAALLAGDIERPQEAAIVNRMTGSDLRADVLLAPHHGSKTSSSPLLLDAVRPRLAIVQSGWRNRFGHPAPEVARRYTDLGIALIDTPHCGAAIWSSAAPGGVRCQRIEARRYWQHKVPP
jgi:competence protein ComEC